jgi:hypothetical protein
MSSNTRRRWEITWCALFSQPRVLSSQLWFMQEDHLYVTTTYNCPMADSLWSVVKRPLALLRELYHYIRHGTGWFLGTIVEMEVFGMASLIAADGSPYALSKEQSDSSGDAKCIPDFSVMAVRAHPAQ